MKFVADGQLTTLCVWSMDARSTTYDNEWLKVRYPVGPFFQPFLDSKGWWRQMFKMMDHYCWYWSAFNVVVDQTEWYTLELLYNLSE